MTSGPSDGRTWRGSKVWASCRSSRNRMVDQVSSVEQGGCNGSTRSSGKGAAVADREALAGLSGNVEFARSRTIEHRVAYQDVSPLGRFRSRADCDGSATQAFPYVVIGFARQAEIRAGDQEGSKALSRGADEFAIDPTQIERGRTEAA